MYLVTRTIADKSGYKFIEEQMTAKDILHRLSAPCNRRKFKGRQTVSHETRVAIDISGPRRACQFREIETGSRASIAALWRSVSTHSVSAIDVDNVFNSSARLVFTASPLHVAAQRHVHATRMILHFTWIKQKRASFSELFGFRSPGGHLEQLHLFKWTSPFSR